MKTEHKIQLATALVAAAFAFVQTAWAAGRLPDGYQEAEYVRFTGNEYINTSFTPNTFDRIEISFMPKVEGYMALLASPSTDVTRWLLIARPGDNNTLLQVRYGYETAVATDSGSVPLKDVRVTLAVDGVTSNMYVSAGEDAEPVQQANKIRGHAEKDFGGAMIIGAGVKKGTADTLNNPANANVYYVRVYGKDGVKKADFVPCYTSGACGFYDLVNDRFCGALSMPNATAAMEHGPDVVQPLWMKTDTVNAQADFEIAPSSGKTRSLYLASGNAASDTTNGWAHVERVGTVNANVDAVNDVTLPASWNAGERTLRGFVGEKTLPDGYEELSYIGANKAQWIDTGFTPYSTDRFEIKFNLRENIYHTLLCCRGTHDSEWFQVSRPKDNSQLWIRCGNSTAITSNVDSVRLNQDVTFAVDCKTKKMYVDGVEQQDSLKPHDYKYFGCPLAVFAGRDKDGTNTNNFSHAYIYYIKVFGEDGTLKADFVPYRDVAKGRCGLYDKITGTYSEEIPAYGVDYVAMDRGEVVGDTVFTPSNMAYWPVDFTVESLIKTAGAITGANLAFTGSSEPRKLWVAWGAHDEGENLADWTNKRELMNVPSGDSCCTVESLPQDISEAVSRNGCGWRFFLAGTGGVDRTDFSKPRNGMIITFR